MSGVERFIRKFRRAVRNRISFMQGALYALTHLRDWAERTKANVEDIQKQYEQIVGGEGQNILYVVIGAALTSWAKMEETLVIICSMLLRTTSEKTGLVLFSIINFQVWLNLIDDLFAVDDRYGQFKPKWNKLASRLRGIKDDRDRVAHHAVDQSSPEDILGNSVLRPSTMDMRQKTRKYKPMDHDDIIHFTKTVNVISSELLELATQMNAVREALLKKSSE
jgi:hypothetical protein